MGFHQQYEREGYCPLTKLLGRHWRQGRTVYAAGSSAEIANGPLPSGTLAGLYVWIKAILEFIAE